MAEITYYEAAGNRFAIVESRDAVARVLGSPAMKGLSLDGVLVCTAPNAGGDCRMEIINRDGTESAACGNGLRCIAHFAFERGMARDRLTIETLAGSRTAEVVTRGSTDTVRTSMGRPRIDALYANVEGHPAAIVDMGNPHCVLFVDDVDTAPVAQIGAHLEHHARFPQRANVEFVQLGDESVRLRVWERGVGETAACGTGASAVAAVAIQRKLMSSPIVIHLPGGTLTASWDGSNELFLEGPVGPLALVRT